ncbi:MAG: hypothetical protein QM831_18505 [Kofleriaceae bacterium]
METAIFWHQLFDLAQSSRLREMLPARDYEAYDLGSYFYFGRLAQALGLAPEMDPIHVGAAVIAAATQLRSYGRDDDLVIERYQHVLAHALELHAKRRQAARAVYARRSMAI